MVNTKKRRKKKINLEKKMKERIKIIDRIDHQPFSFGLFGLELFIDGII